MANWPDDPIAKGTMTGDTDVLSTGGSAQMLTSGDTGAVRGPKDWPDDPVAAVTANPSMMRQTENRLPRPAERGDMDLNAILGAGVTEGALGAVAPEILKYGGTALQATGLPLASQVGAAMRVAEPMARSAGRVASATAGAIAGVASETAGQQAELAGAPDWGAFTARMIAGGVAPEVGHMVAKLGERLMQIPALSIGWGATKAAARLLMIKAGMKPSENKRELQFLEDELLRLRGGAKTDAPMNQAYKAIEVGARKLIDDASSAAEREYMDVLSGRVTDAKNAAIRIRQHGETALESAKATRANIGDDVTNTDIGLSIRNAAKTRYDAAVKARRERFAEIEQERNRVVLDREARGEYMKSADGFSELEAFLNAERKGPKNSRDVKEVYNKLWRDLHPRQSPTKDANGNVVEGKPIELSFNAVDQIRRKMGQVFEGNPPTGYDGIDADIARTMYKKLSDLQKSYAGPLQSKILDQYHVDSGVLTEFASKEAQNLIRMNPEKSDFLYDPVRVVSAFSSGKPG